MSEEQFKNDIKKIINEFETKHLEERKGKWKIMEKIMMNCNASKEDIELWKERFRLEIELYEVEDNGT